MCIRVPALIISTCIDIFLYSSPTYRAKATLEAATRKVVKEYKLATEPLKLTFKGLGTFGQNVLFAQIEDGPSKDRLINMAGMQYLHYI